MYNIKNLELYINSYEAPIKQSILFENENQENAGTFTKKNKYESLNVSRQGSWSNHEEQSPTCIKRNELVNDTPEHTCMGDIRIEDQDSKSKTGSIQEIKPIKLK